jgi:Hemerythrin HHE cation binding domain
VPLSHDHHHALALAFRLRHPSPPGQATAMTPASTPASRGAEALAFFAGDLAGHFRAEEEVLFPAIAAQLRPGSAEAALLADLIADHRRLETIRGEIASALAGAASAGETVLASATLDFAERLEAHVRREERELFVRFAELVPADEAARVGPAIGAILAARPSVRRT